MGNRKVKKAENTCLNIPKCTEFFLENCLFHPFRTLFSSEIGPT